MEIKINVSSRFWQNLLWPIFCIIWFIEFLGETRLSPRQKEEFWFGFGMIWGFLGGIATMVVMGIVFNFAWYSWILVWIWGFGVVTAKRNCDHAYD
jgi:hypothetical protein